MSTPLQRSLEEPEPSRASALADAARTRPTYILVLLTAVAFCYQLDRNVLYVTQELVKREFALSDTQLGMVTGLAFGLANGLAGIPLGWLNDRVNRVKLLAVCVFAWSGLTTACGFASNFATLFIARCGVGLAEAGGTPISLSLLTDIYPAKQRASKIGIVSAGYGAGTVVSSLAGGYVAAHFGWRAAFLLYGLPGIALGLIFATTVREPARSRSANERPIAAKAIPQAIGHLVRQPGLRVLFLGTALTSMTSGGVSAWWASFMMRTHHLDLPTVGLISTVALGVCATLGTIAAGYATDWARRLTPGGPFLVISATSLINLVFASLALWTDHTGLMIAALCATGATTTAYLAPRGAALSELAPPHLRGLTFTLPIVISALVGVAMGGVTVGALSDLLARRVESGEALRVAMFLVLLVHIPVACMYLFTARSMAKREAAARN